jgi:hypothetical protein
MTVMTGKTVHQIILTQREALEFNTAEGLWMSIKMEGGASVEMR